MKKSKYTVGNFSLRVGKSYAGKGLFANEVIPKGACVVEYIGKEIKKEDQERARGKYIFATGRDLMIDGNVKENIARFINHSCKPNCEPEGPRGKVFIMTLKKIKAGEELTYDYGKDYFDEHIKPKGCRCQKCTTSML
ncbi:MAG: SET domain-containing protein-lysine N-methyltransferase [Candidatus Paceibacterota bacterium]|jgi:hypothetical protein